MPCASGPRTGAPFSPERSKMGVTRAVVVDPAAPGRLVIRPVAEPTPQRGEALVRVRAISLAVATNALAELERAGVCVTLGASAGAEVTFDARAFFTAGRSALYGLYLFTEFGAEPARIGLRRLADGVATGQLSPHISVERPWTEIGRVAQDLMARRFPGKAVLALD